MATTHDPLDFRIGDTWDISGPLHDSDGLPLNLTGASLIWKLDSVDGAVNHLTLTLGAGIIVKDPVTALIRVRATPVQTGALGIGSYLDSLRIIFPDGNAFTEWSGIIRAGAILL